MFCKYIYRRLKIKWKLLHWNCIWKRIERIKEHQICWADALFMSFQRKNEDGTQTETGIIFLDIAKNKSNRHSVDNNRNNVRYKTLQFADFWFSFHIYVFYLSLSFKTFTNLNLINIHSWNNSQIKNFISKEITRIIYMRS